MPGGCLVALLFQSVGVGCVCGHSADISIVASLLPRVDDVACLVVGAELTVYLRALRGRCWTRDRRSRGAVACLGLTSLLQVDQRVRLLQACSPNRAGGHVPMARGGPHAPPASGCCGGALAAEDPQAWADCVGASLRRQCSGRPIQIARAHWHPRRWPVGRTPTRHQHITSIWLGEALVAPRHEWWHVLPLLA
jgi:hypothetical protein